MKIYVNGSVAEVKGVIQSLRKTSEFEMSYSKLKDSIFDELSKSTHPNTYNARVDYQMDNSEAMVLSEHEQIVTTNPFAIDIPNLKVPKEPLWKIPEELLNTPIKSEIIQVSKRD